MVKDLESNVTTIQEILLIRRHRVKNNLENGNRLLLLLMILSVGWSIGQWSRKRLTIHPTHLLAYLALLLHYRKPAIERSITLISAHKICVTVCRVPV